MNTQAAVYVRISEDRSGEGRGVGRQEDDCRALAARLGAEVLTVYCDNDTSAYSGKRRPQYEALCAAVESGAVDLVLAWHPDRLHRSPIELEQFIALIERRGVEVHTVQAGIWDLSTPSGRMVARQLGAVARYESEHKAARVGRARQENALSGRYCGGRRPFGYEDDGVTLRPAEAAEVERLTTQLVSGVSVRQLTRELNDQGITTSRGNPWTTAELRALLTRPRNAGHSVHKGEVVGRAVWPQLVTEELWQAACSILKDPSRVTSPGPTPRWLGSGLYVCGVCESSDVRVHAASAAGEQPWQRRRRYRCRGTGVYRHVARDANKLDHYVEHTIVARLSQPEALDKLLTSSDDGGQAVELRVERASIRQRLDSLAGMFAAGEIDTRQFATATKALKSREAEIDARLAAIGTRSPLEVFAGKDIRRVWFGEGEDRVGGLTLGQRRAIVESLVTVKIMPGKPGKQSNGKYFDPDSVRIDWKR